MKILFAIERFVAYLLYYTGVYWFARTRLERAGAGVVLVYHRIQPGMSGSGQTTGEEAFDWQMRFICERCRPVDWPAMRTAGTAGPIRVLVTFDDGYRDNFTRALPIMERYGVHGVFFLATDFVFGGKPIDGSGDAPDDGAAPTGDQLRSAQRSPLIVFGNHTATHRFVSELDEEEWDRELTESQSRFQERLGEKPVLFAYPRGRRGDYTAAAVPALERHGFEAAFTMEPGVATRAVSPYFVPRIGMSHVNDEIVFKVKMVGLLAPLTGMRNALARRAVREHT